MLLLFVVLLVLPKSWGLGEVQPTDITYYVYVKEYVNPLEIGPNDTVQPGSHIILLIHGWTEDRNVEWYSQLKDALLAIPGTDYEVIEVDWSRIADLEYFKAAASVGDVGKYIGEFILSLGVSLENVHIIGHSMGAQVASFAGKYIASKDEGKIQRITGLDPAGPGFIFLPEPLRINKEDAEVVVIIHTDLVLGFAISCGRIDFWPNGGHDQPGCKGKECKGPICYCNHHRSYLLYIDAILRPGTLLGRDIVRKDIILDMGGTITKENQPGDYYLATNAEAPYGLR